MIILVRNQQDQRKAVLKEIGINVSGTRELMLISSLIEQDVYLFS